MKWKNTFLVGVYKCNFCMSVDEKTLAEIRRRTN